MKRVVIESPYAGDIERNLKYLRSCIRDCLMRGEAPIASHGLYTQEGILDDDIPEERRLGIGAGWAWHKVATTIVAYCDLGITEGMSDGITHAEKHYKGVEFRTLGRDWEKHYDSRTEAKNQEQKSTSPKSTQESTSEDCPDSFDCGQDIGKIT